MSPHNEFGQPIGEPVPGWVPPTSPGSVALKGSEVVVRPLVADDLPALFESVCRVGDEAAWTYLSSGPFASVGQLAAYVDGHLRGTDRRPMAVEGLDGVVQGMACYLRITPSIGTVEIGAIIFGPALRRTRAATEALSLMIGHVIDLGYRRCEWKCDSFNGPSRRAALRLGFVFEGVWRSALMYKGRNRDTAWFGLTDADWAVVGPVHQRWLADTAGGARQPWTLRDGVATARTHAAQVSSPGYVVSRILPM